MKVFASNRKIRLTAVIAAAALVFSACGRTQPGEPTEAPETSEPQTSFSMPEGSITLPYTSLDSVSPFYCSSLLNSALVPLVFQPLYCLDGAYDPAARVAVSETVTPTSVKVNIADNVVFSDSSPLTSADVVYSFEKAKESALYSTSLANFESCEADGNYSVLFTLKEADINAVNLLTFPIARLGSADSAEVFPVGSGYYVYSRDDLRLSLEINAKYGGATPQIGLVRLYDITDSSSLMHLLDTGGIDCFFTDLSEGTAKRSFSGTSEVYLNNLVFLGFNFSSYRLSSADVRRAVSLAVSRSVICENAFLSHARAAFYPFNTSWSKLSGLSLSAEKTGDSAYNAADALLDTVGAGFGGDTLYYKLICVDEGTFMPAAARLIAEQLSGVNINVSVELMSKKDFDAALESGDFDLYLSEIKLTDNMDISPFLTSSGAAARGIDLSSVSVDEKYGLYRSERLELGEFLDAFYEEMPFVPLLFRNGQFCYSRTVKGAVETTENNLFFNIADWVV